MAILSLYLTSTNEILLVFVNSRYKDKSKRINTTYFEYNFTIPDRICPSTHLFAHNERGGRHKTFGSMSFATCVTAISSRLGFCLKVVETIARYLFVCL